MDKEKKAREKVFILQEIDFVREEIEAVKKADEVIFRQSEKAFTTVTISKLVPMEVFRAIALHMLNIQLDKLINKLDD